jgi:hypothetical protein
MKIILVCRNWFVFKNFSRKHSSKEWLSRQNSDPYVEKAKVENYRYVSWIYIYIFYAYTSISINDDAYVFYIINKQDKQHAEQKLFIFILVIQV